MGQRQPPSGWMAINGVNDSGVAGPGPDELILPSDIAVGIRRICTAAALDDCRHFTIE